MRTLGEQIKGAANAAERDSIYATAAINVAPRSISTAREIASKISNHSLRQRVYAFIDSAAVRAAISQKNIVEILRLARNGDLQDVERVYALTEAAGILLKTDNSRTVELLDEALTIARRIDTTQPNRARALMSVASTFIKFDSNRAWETMSEVVKAVNTAKEFAGDDAQMMTEIRLKDNTFVTNYSVPSFNLATVFSALAVEDIARTVELAKTLTGESPRAAAILAIARGVLEERPKPSRPRPI